MHRTLRYKEAFPCKHLAYPSTRPSSHFLLLALLGPLYGTVQGIRTWLHVSRCSVDAYVTLLVPHNHSCHRS